jgi:nucleoid-associated protein YgaU
MTPGDPTPPGALPPTPANSRYFGVPVAVTDTLRYFRRRFLPPPLARETAVEHVVVPGDRLDLLADRYYGDPLLAWRIADANVALDPAELVATPGRVVRIPRPDGTGAP